MKGGEQGDLKEQELKKPEVRLSLRFRKQLEDARGALGMDAWACRVLSEPLVIAHMAKFFVPDFRDMTIPEIMSCMDGGIDVDIVQVFPDDAVNSADDKPKDSSEGKSAEGVQSEAVENAGRPEEIQAEEQSGFAEADLSKDGFLRSTTLTDKSATDKSASDGTTAYDDFVGFRIPPAPGGSNGKEKKTSAVRAMRIIIDLESQNELHPLLRVQYRIQYYAARLVSSQRGRELGSKDYENLTAVYTIWIMPDAPEHLKNQIIRYGFFEHPEDVRKRAIKAAEETVSSFFAEGTQMQKIEKEPLIKAIREAIEGAIPVPGRMASEDWHTIPTLLNAVLLFVGDPEEADSRGLRLTDIVFTDTMSPSEKMKALEDEFDFPRIQAVKEDLTKMGGFGAALEKRVTEQVTKQVTNQVMFDTALSTAQGLIALDWTRDSLVRFVGEHWPSLSAKEVAQAVDEAYARESPQ